VDQDGVMTNLRVGDRFIGLDAPALIIAELGVNHDGSVDRALEMVDLAADCGADAVKLQVFRAQTLLHRSCRLAEYQERSGAPSDPAEMLRKFELPPDALRTIAAHIRKRGLLPVATPFSPTDIPTLATLNLAAVKIASPDLVNRVLLREATSLSLPLLLSTGAATLEEIDHTVGWLGEGQTPFALLHCISSYPTEAQDAHLSWISDLKTRFGVPIGFSDHTTDITCGALAVAAGARLIERHLTYNRSAPGPDHCASSDPEEFARYVTLIRAAEKMLGSGGKRVLPCEEDVRTVSRQSLILRRDVPARASICRDDLTVQRPGTGISAARIDDVLGKRATRDLRAGAMLTWEMIGGEPMRRSA
jgi:N,N'-diacetyllegionaminate synthase